MISTNDFNTLHREAVVVDGHCDTVHLFLGNKEPYSFGEKNDVGHIDLPRLREGGVDVQFFAVYIEPEFKPYGALRRTLTLIEYFWREMEKCRDSVTVVQSTGDLESALLEKKLAVLLSMEGGEPLEDLDVLHVLYRLGLRSVGLTWNQRNMLADGVGVGQAAGGLTHLGQDMVREMNKLGMIVDAAHLAPRGFYDLLDAASAPFVVTHANAKAVCDHRRNLDDDQLRALQEQGGVVGLTYYPPFVHRSGLASLDDLLDHFCHIAEHIGTDVLALGSDFDGIPESVRGLDDVSLLPNLTEGLLKRGFSSSEIKNILGGNFLRVLRTVLK
ncbi:MAG: dipeptidase [Bacillota bacterium]|nr:dipeptidase [Bacillota bacterium]MDW7684618.1 dipeptidase [Bacillota bacterium]